jgi:protein farnesyltransferase/geranylgeranyltransferase type-1 subunit alpha
LRAVLKSNEISERAFELSKDAALLNPANYTVWYYRRRLLNELGKDYNEELEFISDVIRSNPKNYQVWQHRRSVVEKLQNASQELEFTKQIIRRDSKNYHAWQYRQWAIKKFGLWDVEELNYVNQLLDLDIRNNSAWNQRYFYFSNKHDFTKLDSSEALNSEIDFTLNKIDSCIDNESSWNYLRALINHLNLLNGTKFTYPNSVVDFLIQKLANNREEDLSPFLISFYVEYNQTKANNLLVDDSKVEVKKLVQESIQWLEKLGTRYDTIRVNYWNYLISKWKQQFSDYVL